MISGKILVTGGTGTLGREVVSQLYALHDRQIVVLSREEKKQAEMKRQYPGVKFVLGDVSDAERVRGSAAGCDYVIHLAAMKMIDMAEANPGECFRTNVMGTANVMAACVENRVKKAIFMSTDKVVEPDSAYGASKLMAERMILGPQAKGLEPTKFSVVRSGNIWGSDGSVIPYWEKLAKAGEPLPLTDAAMYRYFISASDLAGFILEKLETMEGGEIFIPPCKKHNMRHIAADIIVAFGSKSDITIVGLRPGEKLVEELMTEKERKTCTAEYTIKC